MTTLSKIQDTGYELNDEFIGWVRDHYNGDDFDLDEVIMDFNATETYELFSDRCGVYIPKFFAEIFNEGDGYELKEDGSYVFINDGVSTPAVWTGIKAEDLKILIDKVDDFEYDGYWDLWNDILNSAELKYMGKTWTLDHDADLYVRSENYIFPEF